MNLLKTAVGCIGTTCVIVSVCAIGYLSWQHVANFPDVTEARWAREHAAAYGLAVLPGLLGYFLLSAADQG